MAADSLAANSPAACSMTADRFGTHECFQCSHGTLCLGQAQRVVRDSGVERQTGVTALVLDVTPAAWVSWLGIKAAGRG